MNNDANHAIRPFIVAPVTRFLKTYRDEPTFDITEVLRYGDDTTLVVGYLIDKTGEASHCFFVEQTNTYFALGSVARAHGWLKDKFRKVDVSVLIDFSGTQRPIKNILPDYIKVRRRRFVPLSRYPRYKTGAPPAGYIGYHVHDLKAAAIGINAFTEFYMTYRIDLHAERLSSVIYIPDNDANRKVLSNATPIQKVGDVHRHPLRRARGRRHS